MTVGVVQNLRGFANSHPPLLVFSSCLLAFGVTMIVLAYIIGGTELPNPDIDMDWNVFLTHLSELHYCVGPQSNPESGGLQFGGSKRSVPPLTTSNATADVPGVKAVDRVKSLSALLPDLGSGDPKDDSPNVTVAVAVPATFFREALSSPVFWHGNARGYMLGFSGKRAKEQLLLTMILWPRINDTTAACAGKHCHVDTDTCIILQGPSHLMPKTKRPPRCFLEAVPPSVSRQVFLQRSAADTGGRVNCSGGIWTSFLYKPNPELTVMLSYGDRSLVNLHLIHTSYFLFFVVMTLACYAIIRGRFHKVTLEKYRRCTMFSQYRIQAFCFALKCSATEPCQCLKILQNKTLYRLCYMFDTSLNICLPRHSLQHSKEHYQVCQEVIPGAAPLKAALLTIHQVGLSAKNSIITEP